MVVHNDKLRWAGGSLILVNLAMLLVWGWATFFAGPGIRLRVVCCRVVG
jgi:hypothetical protein